MKCKVFEARSRSDLEEQVNQWLETHPVSPESMRFEYACVSLEDSIQFVLEHTLVLFYVPFTTVR